AIRDVLDSTLLLSGHSIRPLWVSVNSPALIEAAKAGLGIAVLPHILIKNDLKNGSLISLDVKGLSLENELFAVWHKDKYLPAPQKALLSCIIPADTHDALGEVSLDSL
ncbi:LysR substrate-binding domain-containing protein, partial [Blautia pseudococcoides]|nr:LysR substrate-binding domain-containing protein [Blautia pseudococcoides]